MAILGWSFWVIQPFVAIFQSISSCFPERRYGRREKKAEQPLSEPIACTMSPCPSSFHAVRLFYLPIRQSLLVLAVLQNSALGRDI